MSDALEKLKKSLDNKLTEAKAVPIAFPPCSDVLLALIEGKGYKEGMLHNDRFRLADPSESDEIAKLFLDYFGFNTSGSNIVEAQGPHSIISRPTALDEGWLPNPNNEGWPPNWCLPPSYVTLRGQRHFYIPEEKNDKGERIFKVVKRLFIGDLVWLFFMERMGLFQINGRILDEFAYKGGFPISNGGDKATSSGPSGGGSNTTDKDKILALVLEAMTRQMEMRTASSIKCRTAAFRTCLGWTSEIGRGLGLQTVVNTAFNNQFHKFIYLASEYYRERRIGDSIRGISGSGTANTGATKITLRDTLNLLRRSFDNFSYGRNYYNTLSGIVWAIASISVIRELRQTIGIPTQYDEAYEYIPAAYNILVSNTPSTPSDTNRYETHFQCAVCARDILIDVELLTLEDDADLTNWLELIETKVEGYRTAYRALTGVDLGATQNPVIEQQA